MVFGCFMSIWSHWSPLTDLGSQAVLGHKLSAGDFEHQKRKNIRNKMSNLHGALVSLGFHAEDPNFNPCQSGHVKWGPACWTKIGKVVVPSTTLGVVANKKKISDHPRVRTATDVFLWLTTSLPKAYLNIYQHIYFMCAPQLIFYQQYHNCLKMSK